MGPSRNKSPLERKVVKSLLLHKSQDDLNVSLDIIWKKRPLIFTLPKIEHTDLKELMDEKNYTVDNFKNVILGMRNDLKVLGVDFKLISTFFSSDLSAKRIDEFIELALNNQFLKKSPFSKEDELDILEAIF